jgi:hypothetical protein
MYRSCLCPVKIPVKIQKQSCNMMDTQTMTILEDRQLKGYNMININVYYEEEGILVPYKNIITYDRPG